MDENKPREPPQGRRYFLKGIAGLGVGTVLLATGVLERLIRFFSGPRMSPREESALLEQRLEQHKETAEIEGLEIARLRNDYLPVAKLSDLKPTTGIYFYDYLMRPALAFLDKDGLPHLISAKCTHLGCTIGNTVDPQGDLLCPCHLSLFKVENGAVERGPATEPLPLLGWALKDPTGKIVASKPPLGTVTGTWDKTRPDTYSVCIAQKYKGGKAL